MSTVDASHNALLVANAVDDACKHWANGDVDAAFASCQRALALDPANVPALANSGTIMWVRGDAVEAERLYAKAHSLDPAHVGVMLDIATLRNEEGDLTRSLQWIEKAEAALPGSREVQWRKALVELAMGDYVNGWRHYEAGLAREGMRGRNPGFETAPWNGSPCRRLLLWHEQGLGDTVQFVRYAKLCRERAESVVVLCPSELVSLLKRCPFVDDATDAIRAGDFEQHVSIMSLPHLFRTTIDTIPAPIPYLFAADALATTWERRMRHGGLRVGLAWSGNMRKDLRLRVIDRNRRLPVEAIRSWLDVPDITFYSLQKGDAGNEAEGCDIVNLMNDFADFGDTAAIIANLDLVISVDTSVAHVAGAMGKPLWVLSRVDACWRWLRNRPDSPWYPTARVFGQTERGNWRSVVEAIKRELVRLQRGETHLRRSEVPDAPAERAPANDSPRTRSESAGRA